MEKRVLQVILPALLLFQSGCKSKTEMIQNFQPINVLEAKPELIQRFGKPDSIVAFCTGDTSYLFKVEKGCIEWKFIKVGALPYTVNLNDSCKIEEGEYVSFDYQPRNRPIEKGWDSNGWQINAAFDSAIGVSRYVNEWQAQNFIVTNRDTGEAANLFRNFVRLDLQNKKSIMDKYCRRLEYLVRYKYGDKSGFVSLGASNFPDETYNKLRLFAYEGFTSQSVDNNKFYSK